MQQHPDNRPDDDWRLSEDEIFTILAVQRRRELLRELKKTGGEATFGQLTEAIATGESTDVSTPRGRKAVYVSLHQTHVPRLVKAGVVARDDERKSLRLTDRAADLVAYLEFDPAEKPGGFLSRVLRSRARERVE